MPVIVRLSGVRRAANCAPAMDEFAIDAREAIAAMDAAVDAARRYAVAAKADETRRAY